MYKAREGIYEDGKITLEETPELKRSKVMVTLTLIYLSIPLYKMMPISMTQRGIAREEQGMVRISQEEVE